MVQVYADNGVSGTVPIENRPEGRQILADTKRLAQTGAWLGGIVPFWYRKQGERRETRLVIAETELPGVGISEAEVVKHIYRMAPIDRLSCRAIAECLNDMGVPCAYTRDDRLLLKGKRKQRTSGIWRAGRVRNLLISPTYKGTHEYGKRSTLREKVVTIRQVPAIVSEELWSKAQNTLAENFLFGARNAKNRYLLRGLMKCSRCALTFIGTSHTQPNGKHEFIIAATANTALGRSTVQARNAAPQRTSTERSWRL